MTRGFATGGAGFAGAAGAALAAVFAWAVAWVFTDAFGAGFLSDVLLSAVVCAPIATHRIRNRNAFFIGISFIELLPTCTLNRTDWAISFCGSRHPPCLPVNCRCRGSYMRAPSVSPPVWARVSPLHWSWWP